MHINIYTLFFKTRLFNNAKYSIQRANIVEISIEC